MKTANGEKMSVESAVRMLAGTMVLISVGLAVLVSPWWLALTTFVGLNLFQSSLTGFCPAEKILGRCMGAPACSTAVPTRHLPSSADHTGVS